MAHLTLTGIGKSYGAQPVLQDINIDVPSGEFVVFVGHPAAESPPCCG